MYDGAHVLELETRRHRGLRRMFSSNVTEDLRGRIHRISLKKDKIIKDHFAYGLKMYYAIFIVHFSFCTSIPELLVC